MSESEITSIQPAAVTLFTGHDIFGPVEIMEDRDTRWMQFAPRIKQSVMSLQDPYFLEEECTQLMMMALLFHRSPKSVLALGLGGGSIPKFIWKYFPQAQVDTVERSPLVIDLCYRYFAFPKSKRLKVFQADAFDFIKQCQSKYDIIFLDLFQAEGLSALVAEERFFNACQDLLTENGILVWNTWNNAPKPLLLESIQQITQTFGKNLMVLPSKSHGNLAFLMFQKPVKMSLFSLTQRAHRLEKKTHLNFFQMLADLNFLKEYSFFNLS